MTRRKNRLLFFITGRHRRSGPISKILKWLLVWNALMSKTIIDALAAHSASKSCGISQLILKLQMSTDDNPIWLWSHSIIVSHIYPYKRVQKKRAERISNPIVLGSDSARPILMLTDHLIVHTQYYSVRDSRERSEIALVIYFFS